MDLKIAAAARSSYIRITPGPDAVRSFGSENNSPLMLRTGTELM
jgi:hypothetical protein